MQPLEIPHSWHTHQTGETWLWCSNPECAVPPVGVHRPAIGQPYRYVPVREQNGVQRASHMTWLIIGLIILSPCILVILCASLAPIAGLFS